MGGLSFTVIGAPLSGFTLRILCEASVAVKILMTIGMEKPFG